MHGMETTDRMFSVREAPWHGLGKVLTDYPARAVAMAEAGLEWTVEETAIYRKVEREGTSDWTPAPTFPKIGDWKALYRSDTNDILHVAKDSYAVVQNIVGFEIGEALLDADQAVLYETGGSIKGGAQCYLTLRVNEPVLIDGDDSPTFPYVVVTWTHDGSGAVQARATNVRVVCWNTLSASEAEAARTGRKFTFRHTKNVMSKIDDAKQALAGVRAEHGAFVEIANELARIDVSDETRERFVTTFVPMPEADVISDRVRENILRARNQVRGLFTGQSIPEAHRNTAYGLLLAGGEYLDHLRASRNSDTYLGRTLLRDEALKAKLVPQIKQLVSV